MQSVNINMRLYRRFDADLIALNENIPVNLLAEILLDKYAKGEPIKIIPDGCEPFDVGKRKNIHLTVKTRSKEATNLILQIKYGYRNQFCKSLVRDALMTDPLWVYFNDGKYVEKENMRILEYGEREDVVVVPAGLRRKDYRLLLNANKEKRKTETSAKIKPKPKPIYTTPKIKQQTKNKHLPRAEDRFISEEIEEQKDILNDIEGWDTRIARETKQKDVATTKPKHKEQEEKQKEVQSEVQTEEKGEEDINDLLDSFESIF